MHYRMSKMYNSGEIVYLHCSMKGDWESQMDWMILS